MEEDEYGGSGAEVTRALSPAPCRREPARDSGLSATSMLTDTPLSRAGSLLQDRSGNQARGITRTTSHHCATPSRAGC
ncbi:hypothetical protein EJA71_13510 [Pseudomonas sp. PB106]|nr:hypothetical protein EJA71_13510 [Pseudomonas sp. PB106]